MAQRDGELSNDQVALIVIAIAAVSLLASSWQQVRDAVITWLVEHHVLVTTKVVIAVPTAGGAGLDLRRSAIALAVVVLLGVWAVGAARARTRARTGRR